MGQPLTPDTLEGRLGQLERQVAQLQRERPSSRATYGARDDLTTGAGVRTNLGLLSDGSYGLEVFYRDGTRVVVATTPA